MTSQTPVRPLSAAPATEPRPRPSRWIWTWTVLGAATVLGILLVLVGYLTSGLTGGSVDWGEILTAGTWSPTHAAFGGLAMIYGSGIVCLMALALAVPVSWAAAIALNEYLPLRLARPLRTSVELLAAVPSIVYGLIGIMAIRPLVSTLGAVPGGDSLLAAAIVLAVMITPTVIAVSVDALKAVPDRYRESAYALGLTRQEVVRSAVLPRARPAMRTGVLLGLARALGEAIAVYLVIGRADGRLPTTPGEFFDSLFQPGQTLTTKLAGPESMLAGTSGPHFAALCALGVVLLAAVAAATVLGTRTRHARPGDERLPAPRAVFTALRLQRDRSTAALRFAALLLPTALLIAMLMLLAARGTAAFDPTFWLTESVGSSGGGVRNQISGTLLFIVGTAAAALPLGFAAGILLGVYGSSRLIRTLNVLTVVIGGVPTILLGLAGFVVLSTAMGWGKSWLAGVIVLVPVVVPVVALATAARIRGMPPELTESAKALGLTQAQYLRSVVVPYAWPATITGLLLGLARAAGETAPLLFTATVFAGAPALPGGVVESPVQSLPTHVFNLSQDSGDPQAVTQAWSSALVLIVITALLLTAAVVLRNRLEGQRWTSS
ncbi:phosphate ABC transporter permease subunit PstC [Streptomyces sp. NBRC 109706]|uniref:phosphate ABC transporter permease subunit PstC n=1 Tax=Streptomyces sp. NBRC 109706 TaxID=1550035 RepID=UPI000A3E630F|nr:phosphate ABC transporter permease subunit PstC [Streptomyces sp. NBRC 109706]